MPTPQKYQAAAGTRWRIQYTGPDRKRHTKGGFKTKKQADHWAAQNLIDRNDGNWIDPTSGKVTVGQLGTEWLAQKKAHLKPSTYRVTESAWRIHVQTEWGHRTVASITPAEIQTWASRPSGTPETVRRSHGILSAILDDAVRDRRIPANPAHGARLPRKHKGVKVYLTAEQLRRLAHGCGDREDLILLLGTVGLRWGEAAALRPRDIDLKRRRISVTRNAVTVGGDVVIGTPKSSEARTVAVPAPVLDLIERRMKNTPRDDLLWARPDGEPLRTLNHTSFFHGALSRIMAEDPNFPRLTPHGLRHVAAGLMVSSGANVKVVQRQLGHATASLTLDRYADLFDEDLDGVAARMDELLR